MAPAVTIAAFESGDESPHSKTTKKFGKVTLVLVNTDPSPATSLRQFIGSFRPWGKFDEGGTAALLERLGCGLFLVLLLIGFPIAVGRVVQNGGSDFPDFYAAGKYVWEHGARIPDSNLGRYLPSVDIPWVVATWLPLPLAASIWYLLGCFSWFGLLHAIGRHLLADADQRERRRATLLAGLLAVPLAVDGLCVGAFHVLMVWLMLAGLGRVSRGRSLSGGMLLGLAVWVKLLPALGVAYLLLKRKWLPAAVAVACALAIDIGLSLMAFGPQTAWQEHVNWWNTAAVGSVNRQLTIWGPTDEDRLSNQSVAVALRRLLTRLGDGGNGPPVQVAVADLSRGQVKAVYAAAMALLALGVGWVCRRPARSLSRGQWATEIALIVLATLWFSPVVWSYHPTAATPALALIFSRRLHHRRLSWTVGLLWLLGMVLLGWPAARACADLLWVSLLVGAALTATSPPAAAHEVLSAASDDRPPLPVRKREAA